MRSRLMKILFFTAAAIATIGWVWLLFEGVEWLAG
jgi:hypothetical protein